MKKSFADFLCDNLTDDEYAALRKLKRRQRTKSYPSLYKIVITADRCDYDNLSELAEYPERGFKIGTFYFHDQNQLDLIVKAFEGLFYQLFRVDETERIDGGVIDWNVYVGEEMINMKTIIDSSECKPLSSNIKGKLVVIDNEFFKPEFRDAKYQLVLATGGFGCDASSMGNAVTVIECCENPENYRQERCNLIGEPTEDIINEWKAKYGEFNEEVLNVLNGGN